MPKRDRIDHIEALLADVISSGEESLRRVAAWSATPTSPFVSKPKVVRVVPPPAYQQWKHLNDVF